ncbi:MAG: hypothetical protein QOF04_1133 [Solirubrobacteraceae bacterium]|nr:hypothetical protein [Solirubrobacteraceae bacterium]
MSYRLGVDVGGTFTDFLLLNETSGEATVFKVPSTPDDPSRALVTGLRRLLAERSVAPASLARLMHGTTVATNAVLEGHGAKVGLLCTRGFEHVLHLARGETPGPLAGWITMVKPDPLAAVEDTRGIAERVGSRGEVVEPLDLEHAGAAIDELVERGVESIAISLLHSYSNPAHERRLAELVRERHPGLPVSLSSEVLPEFREYERTNVVVMNAYVRPVMQRYLRQVEDGLEELGVGASVSVLRSDGGLMTVRSAAEKPVNTLFSGPAGGVAGAARVARAAGFPSFLSLDIGGTSTDVALCVDGEATLTRETRLGYFPLKSPSVDVRSVGAGGGSIAHVPEVTRALRVGPQSAGADPGPACYGKGGTEATVTDANLVLGYLPEELLDGEMRLDAERARAAVGRVAEALGVSTEQAAEGILDVANEMIVGALRLVSVEKGLDPRDFALVAFGGAGPLHADALGQLMGTSPVIVPERPGVLAALGDALSPFRTEFAETFIRRFDQLTSEDLGARLGELGARADAWLELEGIAPAQREVRYAVDVRYRSQALEMEIAVEPGDVSLEAIAARFSELHEREYGFRLDVVCELVNLRAVALGREEAMSGEEAAPAATGPVEDAQVGTRRIHRGEWMEARVYDRSRLGPGHRVEGPAIVVQKDSTTLVLPGSHAEVDAHRNLLIRQTTAPAAGARAESPILTDIIESALKNIRREMDAVIFRSAMSPVIREEHDSFPLITDHLGRMIAGQFGWPLDDFFAEHFPRETLGPGDVLMLNDPYLCGGAIQHTPDMLLLRPMFHGDELVGYASQFGNLMDIGGPTPGSMPAQARSIFDEGIRFPPVKLYEGGRLVKPILDILARNSRTPEMTVADTLAMAAATRAAELRVGELCDRFGVETYRAACNRLLERTRDAAALMIEQFIPETPLEFEDYVDDDGRGNGPFRIKLSISRHEGKALLDLTECDDQAEGPINLMMGEAMLKMNVGIVLIMTLDPQILFNHGYNDLIEVRLRPGSILQPRFPAPLSNRAHTLARLMDVVQGALAQQTPELATAAACGSSPHLLFSGRDGSEDFFFYEINYGGIPGRPLGDGMDVHAWWPNFTAIPAEYAENYFPIRVEHVRARADSGGAGLHRGGNGLDKVYVFLAPGEVSIHDDRARSRPWGIGGGEAAHGSRKVLIRRSGEEVELSSKLDFLAVEPGDRLLYLTAGGGGWGDPLARDPEVVGRDVARNLVSVQKARDSYGVVVCEQTGEVDVAATESLRDELRARRPDELPVFDFGHSAELPSVG